MFEKLDAGYVGEKSNRFVLFRLLVAVVLALAYLAWYQSRQIVKLSSDRPVLVEPLGLASQVEITGDDASDEYLAQMGKTITRLGFDFTNPLQLREQVAEMMKIYAPERYQSSNAKWMAVIEPIERQKVYAQFGGYKTEVKRDKERSVIEVTGVERKWANDVKIYDGPKTYVIEYRIKNYRFEILEISEREQK